MLTNSHRVWAAPPETLDNGLRVAFEACEGDRFSVHIAASIGIAHQRSDRPGGSAAWLAQMRFGATPSLGVGDAERVAEENGIVTSSRLGTGHSGMTMSGPLDAFKMAVWLSVEHLDGGPAKSIELSVLRAHLGALAATMPEDELVAMAREGAFGPRYGGAPSQHLRLLLGLGDGPLGDILRWSQERLQPLVVIVAPPAVLARHRRAIRATLGAVQLLWDGGPPPAISRSIRGHGRLPARSWTHDGHHRVVLAWPLPKATERGDAPSTDAAYRRTVIALLNHRAGRLYRTMVDDHHRGLSMHTVGSGGVDGMLVSTMVVGSHEIRRAQDLAAATIESLASSSVSEARLSGAVGVARAAFQKQWTVPEARARTVAGWILTEQAPDPERWHRAVERAFDGVDAAGVKRWASWALIGSTRVVGALVPDTRSAAFDEDAILDAESRRLVTRILVDQRCPVGRPSASLKALLAGKYGLAPKTYLTLSLAIAMRPTLQREISIEVEHRCAIYARLHEVLPLIATTELHEEMACKVGQESSEVAADRAARRLYRRQRLDPSVYRPLVWMAREDPDTLAVLKDIDSRCPNPIGPAGRL